MSRDERIACLFAEALERPESEREGFLRREAADDESMIAEVLDLLRHHSDGFLDEPLTPDPVRHADPKAVGQYRIVRVIGRGGMGVVYEAQQEKPRRRVALKLIQPGMLSESAYRRFAREEEVLGRLQHPGIAQIFEASKAETELGLQPYFAMELVRGLPLDEHCRRRALSVPRRLELMIRVCEAVHHAHQKAVIHRDLKPSNILVDDTGQPKVLDFGIARITDEADGVAAEMTLDRQLVGTLAYMSPEQASQSSSALDIRSDVYSLGVILYQVLAERLPYVVPDRVHEAVQTVRDAEPMPLGRVNPLLGGDLETIVGKALRKDAEGRYASALELADELRRYRQEEPILARPPSTLYHFQKFTRRNRVLVGGAVSTVVALCAGLVLALVLLHRAREAEAVATAKEREASEKAREADLLSNAIVFQNLMERRDQLWPRRAERIPEMQRWIEEARSFAGDLDDYQHAARRLEEEHGRMVHGEEGADAWLFEDVRQDWLHQRFLELVVGIEELRRPDQGWVAEMERRIDYAGLIEGWTVDDYEAEWTDVILAVEEDPRFEGLGLEPVVGLVPLGPDPASGLQEFWCFETGEAPVREEDGGLQIGQSTGLVMVLVPGGRFEMGLLGDSPHLQQSRADRPTHQRDVLPLLVSKYEMTQGQWQHLTGDRVANYGPGWLLPGYEHDLRHPVESVTWLEAEDLLRRHAMTTPTEVQWEYLARAGSDSIWWTGSEPTSVDGAANLLDRSFNRVHPYPPGEEFLRDGHVYHAPVGTYAPNAFGLHDVIGNVSEWCWTGFYQFTSPLEAQERPSRMLIEQACYRGGSFADRAAEADSAARSFEDRDRSSNRIGVRPMWLLE